MKKFLKSKFFLIVVTIISIAASLFGSGLFTNVNAKEKISITEFSFSDSNSTPYVITSGPDGNLWFTENNADKIGKISPNGAIVEFSLHSPNPDIINPSSPDGITAGSDGNLWFTESGGNKIGKITPNGVLTEYSLTINDPQYPPGPSKITSGPDGNLWFTQYKAIGRITPTGTITKFTISTGSYPEDITVGPDGNIWFTETLYSPEPIDKPYRIGRINLNGEIIEFPPGDSALFGITAGPDDNIWFTEPGAGKIGRVNLSPGKGPERDFSLLSPFNNAVTWTVSSGYYNNRDQSSTGCHIGIGPDHCRNQLFGLDMVPDQQNDKEILASANGKVSFKGKLEGGCIGLRIILDNGLNLNVCHFATFKVSTGDRVLRGKVLGTRSTTHVHLSLDDRYRIGTLCPGQDHCYLPIPFDGQHIIEGMSLNPDPNGETVILPYPLCDQRKISCQFKVGFQQYQGLKGTSSNVAIP